MTPVKRNYIYSVAFQVLNILTPLITAPYVSRVFGPQILGDYYFTYSVSSYFSVLAMLGLLNHGSRSVASDQDDPVRRTRTFLEIYSVQLVVSLSALLLYVLMTFLVFPEESRGLFEAGILVVLSAVFDISWFFWGMERFRITALISAITKIVVLCMIFLLVRTREDILIYAFLIGLSFTLSHLCYLPIAFKYLDFSRIRPCEILKGSIRHIKPSVVLFVPVIAVSFYVYFSKILLGMLSDHSELTFFENAYKIIMAPLGIITALGAVMVPRISSIVNVGDFEKVREYLDHSLRYVSELAFPMIFGILAIADLLTDVLFGEGFERTSNVMLVLSGAIIFISWANIVRTTLLIPQKRDLLYVGSVLTGAVVNMVLNLSLIPRYGCMGAAAATLITEMTVFLVQVLNVRSKLDFASYAKSSVRYLLLSVLMYLFIRVFRNCVTLDGMIMLLSCVMLGVMVYAVLVMAFDPFTRQMLRSLRFAGSLKQTTKNE